MKEFDEMIFSYMNLDSKQKKTALLSLLSEDIQNILTVIKNDGVDNVNIINTEIIKNLDINNDRDYYTYLYILIRQLEDVSLKYISLKSPDL